MKNCIISLRFQKAGYQAKSIYTKIICFFNELDILELRLNILNPYVDYFVISEASVTHTGNPKPYYLVFQIVF